MKYEAENLRDILEELEPLLKEHWEEVAWYKDKIKLKPDYEKYLGMEDQDKLLVTTARDNGKLVGYNVNFIAEHFHYSDHVYAVNDIIFVHPDYRHREVSAELINYTEELLKWKGVSVITLHMKPEHAFESLAKYCGFAKQEYVYSKYIGD